MQAQGIKPMTFSLWLNSANNWSIMLPFYFYFLIFNFSPFLDSSSAYLPGSCILFYFYLLFFIF